MLEDIFAHSTIVTSAEDSGAIAPPIILENFDELMVSVVNSLDFMRSYYYQHLIFWLIGTKHTERP
jgi:hypothetical protein